MLKFWQDLFVINLYRENDISKFILLKAYYSNINLKLWECPNNFAICFRGLYGSSTAHPSLTEEIFKNAHSFLFFLLLKKTPIFSLNNWLKAGPMNLFEQFGRFLQRSLVSFEWQKFTDILRTNSFIHTFLKLVWKYENSLTGIFGPWFLLKWFFRILYS